MNAAADTYRLLFDNSLDAMLLIENETFIDCNQAALDMMGYDSKEDMLSTHPSDLSPETQSDGRSSFEKAEELIKLTFEKNGHRFEWLHQRKNKQVFPVEVTLTPIQDGEHSYLHVVWRDITFRKKLESSFQNYQKHLENLVRERTHDLQKASDEVKLLGEVVAQTTSSIMVTDASGIIEYVNPAFCELTGYSRKEAYGKTPGLLNSGKQSSEFYEGMWHLITKGKSWAGEMQNRRKDGSLYWTQAQISPIKDENGEIKHYVGVEDDITELVEQKDLAERANRAKSEYMVSMSNSLRTPINAIVGFAQLIEMGKDNSLSVNQKNQLAEILSAGHRLDKVLGEVIDMAKVESQHTSFLREMVNGEYLILESVSNMFSMADEYGVKIDYDLNGDLPGMMVDSLRLKQVLRELLSNAIKFNKPDGTVCLTANMSDETHLNVEVTDTGVGIAPEDQKLLFQPFQRLNATKRDIPGLGLGLARTKVIVEAMGGKMGFKSQSDQGSSFWFNLPVQDEEG